ncbi:TIGR03032 family protein [Parasphingorhabdus marina DSM 22363]|uniref:TIGR03032 family protein n=1 Tax=Parasphingorhabdus marina DSM 22363 TaxID=1123272 RepID=A0A1N6CNC5_9SPHN|nr:TIGR03032 family protein [Parasphingorhabdus marina]SIN60007.1 TIGR03032 family protein [Parasphingorhabdus marina DSM 22363]
MSATMPVHLPAQAPAQHPQQVAASQAGPAQPKVEYSLSGGLLARLAKLKVSLSFTSYQSGFLYMLGAGPRGGAQLHQSGMPKPMGLCADGPGRLVLSAGAQLIRLENILEADQRINQLYDACFMPRTQNVTGQLDAHDVGVDADGRILFVNTRYNCLATVSERHSFEEVWRPSFISELVDEDRCHLNGLAMRDGKPAFVTAVSKSDTIDGWRDRRADGGVVIDVESGAIVCEGLSMPHSPRWHDGKLWVLNSGTGELGYVEFPDDAPKSAAKAGSKAGAKSAAKSSPKSPSRASTKSGEKPAEPSNVNTPVMGTFKPVAFCPGFLRGLTFKNGYAFVGLSRPRYKRFEGLALDQRLRNADSEPWCGVQVIDLAKGSCVDWFRIDGAIGELYDVELIEGFGCPMTVSPNSPDAATLVTFAGKPE